MTGTPSGWHLELEIPEALRVRVVSVQVASWQSATWSYTAAAFFAVNTHTPAEATSAPRCGAEKLPTPRRELVGGSQLI